MKDPITVETHIEANIEKVWDAFTDPEAIKGWNHASDDWHTVSAVNDVREGGEFSYRMEAKDGSVGFDLKGTYSAVMDQELLAYTMEDGRKVVIQFEQDEDGVRVAETFDPEDENSEEMQREGWQAILNNFKNYCEQ